MPIDTKELDTVIAQLQTDIVVIEQDLDECYRTKAFLEADLQALKDKLTQLCRAKDLIEGISNVSRI